MYVLKENNIFTQEYRKGINIIHSCKLFIHEGASLKAPQVLTHNAQSCVELIPHSFHILGQFVPEQFPGSACACQRRLSDRNWRGQSRQTGDHMTIGGEGRQKGDFQDQGDGACGLEKPAPPPETI